MKKHSLFIAILSFLFAPLTTHADFPDVPATHPGMEAIAALADLGVVQGFPDGTFKPNDLVDRSQFLKMAYLAEAVHNNERRGWTGYALFPFGKESTIKIDPPCFGDLQGTEWFEPYVCWGKQQGLVSGDGVDGLFHPLREVNFAEASKILVETSGQPGVRTGDQVGHWAEGYIEVLGMGMIPGSIQTADQKLTRAQAADLIYNYTLASDAALDQRPSNVLIWENGTYLTFECLGAYDTLHFLRREGAIYWRNIDGAANLYRKLEGADAATFEVLEGGLSKDKNQYYYYPDPLNVTIPNIENLEFVSPNLAISADKAYYFNGPGEVKILDYIGGIPGYYGGEYYMKDASGIYYLDTDQMDPPLVKVEGADPTSFKLVPFSESNSDPFIALDNHALYFGAEKVEGSAGGSFKFINTDPLFFDLDQFLGAFYAKDDEHVFLFFCYVDCEIKGLLANSDAATFKVLAEGYAKDKNQVYYVGDVLAGADASTFTYLGNGYAKDANRAYFWDTLLPEVNAVSFARVEPATSELYCNLPFAKDVDTVFLREKPLLTVDAPSFQLGEASGFFFKDKNKVYHLGLDSKGSLCDADVVTPLAQADLATFKALGTHHFGSNGKVYYVSRSNQVTEVVGADVASFVPLYAELSGYSADLNIDFAKDKNHAYYQGKVLTGIDAASFGYDESLSKWKDKNGTYTWQDLWDKRA